MNSIPPIQRTESQPAHLDPGGEGWAFPGHSMTNAEKIKALEDKFDLLHTFCRELELKIAAIDSEHADTRRRVLLLAPDDDGADNVVEISETQGSIEDK